MCIVIAGLQYTLAIVLAQKHLDIADFDRMIAQGQYVAAEAPLEAYVLSHPESWQAHYQIGYVYFQTHKIVASVKALSRSLALRLDQAEAHKILGFDLTILGKLDLAEREMREAVRLAPNSAESHYELGRICYERGRQPCAVEELEQAIRLDPEYVKAYHNLGLAYEGLGNSDRAIRNFDKALEFNRLLPHPSAWPYTDYAGYLNRHEDFDHALALCLSAVEIDSNSDQAWFEMAKAYRGMGDTNQWVRALERAAQLQHKPEYLYVLAQGYRKQGRKEAARKALSDFEKGRLNPDKGPVLTSVSPAPK